ncbi:probable glycerol-3-phosphate acyltransferase 3 [Ricinus communis]|uniref:Glycerol-3-phosphate acyltransferase, putative n=1 Tax=Ricinus communis TaxID=3988 RepID=B9RJD8_RICCO|nr:probable glycerol-3-phosphate acyltransferase 3 [Ricinus communis]EEF48440.1 Glycerol-3-phosphate acyltransferase, putative [Ricinus communis]|eukprot:XP_002513857.1 probable glycerol-3-phosphate acyltransferase 3 [Ricinus communis]
MASFWKLFLVKTILSLSIILLRRLGLWQESKISNDSHSKFQKQEQQQQQYYFVKSPLADHLSQKQTLLVFDVESTLLKSPSLFPYFVLVAFEAGGLFRALVLLLFYPFVCFLGNGNDLGLNIMVFISFFGIRKDRSRVVRDAVLPKFFLGDVGWEGFDIVMNYGKKKIGVSKLPKVMVEGFLKDYMGVEGVVGRELMVINGYYVGLMESKEMDYWGRLNEFLIEEKNKIGCYTVGIACSSNRPLHTQLLRHCQEVYSVTEAEKRNWRILPRERYPKPLIFHDSRLAFRPTPFATIAMFMWLPIGLFLCIIRLILGILLPFRISSPILALTGKITVISKPKRPFISTKNEEKPTKVLYACNHRTLLDPIYISFSLMKPVTALTYSMSRFNEVISPIRTVRLTRDREQDRKQMNKVLSQGDLVVCPEGTTCREPYLLRFSPLFAELADEIVPVAIDVHVTMFYGSTATGLKCLDPVFHLLNPQPIYLIKILEKLPSFQMHMEGGTSKYDVANYVQNEIAKTLGFESTGLTRKDKYIALAGNNGII